MRKIAFIEPKSPAFHVFSRFRLPRLGAPLLGTLLRRAGYDVRVYVEDIASVDFRDVLRSDAVCISSITSTAPRAYQIADRVREAGIPVIMGGPHPTALPDEAIGRADYVLRGEAEETLPMLLEAMSAGSGFERVPGLCYRLNGDVAHNPAAPHVTDLNRLPSPDLSLIVGHERMRIVPVMTSRGCPHDCTFCAVTAFFGRRYRYRSTEAVIEDLQRAARRGGRFLFFYDDNFAANRARTKALLEEMARRGLTQRWTAQVRVDVAKDEELMRLMKRTGCHTVYVGFESIEPATLAAYHKGQTREEIEYCIRRLREHRIRIHGMFIFGADADSVETLRRTGRFAVRMGIDTVQFMILTPLPGTRLHEELNASGRIFTKDWSLYDAHHVVHRPAQMSPLTLHYETYKALAKFYSEWQVLKRYLRFDWFGGFLKGYGYALVRRWQRRNKWFRKVLDRVSAALQQIDARSQHR